MFSTRLILAAFLVSFVAGARADEGARDARYPVAVSPEESVRQKAEMRGNLVALRATLARLADKDFAGVETALKQLDHGIPSADRPGASTEVFHKLEAQFQQRVDKTIAAARSGNTDVVLRELSETMAYCQSCHMAFRQDVGQKPASPSTH